MIVAVIPARIGSTRVPKKPLQCIGGVPMIVAVSRRVRESGAFDRVVVACDHKTIADVVRADGGEAILTGPAPSGTHRVALVMREISADYVVNVQGDQPFIPTQHLVAIATGVQRYGVCTLATPWKEVVAGGPRVCVWVDGGLALDFSRDPHRRLGRSFWHQGTYGFEVDRLRCCVAAKPSVRNESLEQLSWLEAGISIGVLPIDSPAFGIDTVAQLNNAQARDLLNG